MPAFADPHEGSRPAAGEPPQVSVLVPCWNAAGSIARALASVLDAAGPAVQVIVVDDRSTDDTVSIVRAIAERDPRVELVHAPENGGASAARNLGLPWVRGEWLTFLDSDDRLLPGAIGALHGAATSTDALAVVGQRIWTDGHTTWISKPYDRPDIRQPGRKSLVRNPGLMFYASGTGKLFHRSVFEGLRFEGRVLGDQPWTLRALLRAGDRIEVIGDVVYEWTRPGPGHEFTSITEEKRRSAAKAAEAVVVASDAWRAVADEADLVLADEAARCLIGERYLDRLVRSDFAGPVSRALETRDPGTRVLFEALADFLAALPPAIVANADAVPERLIWPPAYRWDRLPVDARPAFWRMVRSVPAGRALRTRVGPYLWAQAVVRLARRFPGRAGEVAAGGAALLASLVARPVVRLRRRRRSPSA